MNKPEWKIITIGCFACFIIGGIQPISAVLLTKIVQVSVISHITIKEKFFFEFFFFSKKKQCIILRKINYGSISAL